MTCAALQYGRSSRWLNIITILYIKIHFRSGIPTVDSVDSSWGGYIIHFSEKGWSTLMMTTDRFDGCLLKILSVSVSEYHSAAQTIEAYKINVPCINKKL